jgi:hypothetical protein
MGKKSPSNDTELPLLPACSCPSPKTARDAKAASGFRKKLRRIIDPDEARDIRSRLELERAQEALDKKQREQERRQLQRKRGRPSRRLSQEDELELLHDAIGALPNLLSAGELPEHLTQRLAAALPGSRRAADKKYWEKKKAKHKKEEARFNTRVAEIEARLIKKARPWHLRTCAMCRGGDGERCSEWLEKLEKIHEYALEEARPSQSVRLVLGRK